jgi:protein gp37
VQHHAVHVGKVEVEDGGVVDRLADPLQRFLGAVRAVHLEPLSGQHVPQHLHDVLLVVHQEDAQRDHAGRQSRG